MAMRLQLLAIGSKVWRQRRYRVATHRRKELEAPLSHQRKGLRTGGCHANRWVWLLQGARDNGHIVNVMIGPMIGKALGRPGLEHNLQVLVEQLPSFCH